MTEWDRLTARWAELDDAIAGPDEEPLTTGTDGDVLLWTWHVDGPPYDTTEGATAATGRYLTALAVVLALLGVAAAALYLGRNQA